MWRGLPTTGKWTFYEWKGVANVWRDMNFISAGAEAKELLGFSQLLCTLMGWLQLWLGMLIL